MGKRILAIVLVCIFLCGTIGCSHVNNIRGEMYRPYGLVNKSSEYSPKIEYKPVWGNIALGILGIGFWFIPTIYVFGFDFMEPVGLRIKSNNNW